MACNTNERTNERTTRTREDVCLLRVYYGHSYAISTVTAGLVVTAARSLYAYIIYLYLCVNIQHARTQQVSPTYLKSSVFITTETDRVECCVAWVQSSAGEAKRRQSTKTS